MGPRPHRLAAFRDLIGLGRAQEALHQLDVARHVAAERRLPGVPSEVEEADATYRASQGDWEGACRAHVRFHEEHVRLPAQRGTARAVLAQAPLDATTARRDRDRFRALASTDSLTGLPNRRSVEGHVRDVLDGPGPVSVVVRDRWSPASVAASAEALRALVAGYDRHRLTAGLPVTVSTGLAGADEQRRTCPAPMTRACTPPSAVAATASSVPPRCPGPPVPCPRGPSAVRRPGP